MDELLADQLLNELRLKNYTVLPGLMESEIKHIEAYGKFTFPPDLKMLLSKGVPSDTANKFSNWHDNSQEIIDDAKDFINARFAFDVSESGY